MVGYVSAALPLEAFIALSELTTARRSAYRDKQLEQVRRFGELSLLSAVTQSESCFTEADRRAGVVPLLFDS